MAKDPAFLFYPNDYIGGTMGMTFEEKGAYMELLMMQFNRGHMTSHMIGQTVGQLWDKLQDKFIQDEDGRWYNVRLEEEQNKRKAFTDSRKNNIKGINGYTKKRGRKTGHMTSHMENENENENIDTIKEGDSKEGEANQVIDYLNEFAGKKFKHSKTSRENILARLKEGITIEQCKQIIRTKSKEWLGSDMEGNLNPTTLFRPKHIENYLNTPEPAKFRYARNKSNNQPGQATSHEEYHNVPPIPGKKDR